MRYLLREKKLRSKWSVYLEFHEMLLAMGPTKSCISFNINEFWGDQVLDPVTVVCLAWRELGLDIPLSRVTWLKHGEYDWRRVQHATTVTDDEYRMQRMLHVAGHTCDQMSVTKRRRPSVLQEVVVVPIEESRNAKASADSFTNNQGAWQHAGRIAVSDVIVPLRVQRALSSTRSSGRWQDDRWGQILFHFCLISLSWPNRISPFVYHKNYTWNAKD